jgi:hypothetical protein
MRRKEPPDGGRAGRGRHPPDSATQNTQSLRQNVAHSAVSRKQNTITGSPARLLAHVFLENDGQLSIAPAARIGAEDLERLRAARWLP